VFPLEIWFIEQVSVENRKISLSSIIDEIYKEIYRVHFHFDKYIVVVVGNLNKGGRDCERKKQIDINDLAGIYKDVAEVIGIESTIILHDNFKGQQITLPKKLYTRDYIVSQVKDGIEDNNIKAVAHQYGYTERRLRQILKERKTSIV
jgi:hypothetical protein